MGTKSKKKSRQDAFKPPELNGEAIQAIAARCCQDGAVDEQAARRCRADIRYLMGQLAPVHEGVKEFEVNAACLVRYDGKFLDSDAARLIALGAACNLGSARERDGQKFFKLSGRLRPTLFPNDPKFAGWQKTPDGLAVQLEDAMDRGKSTENLLPLCKKAAEAGNVEIQYLLGKLYEGRNGSEDDYVKAAIWYQKAAKQGHEEAKSGFAHCQIVVKALRGDAEAQYQYGKQLEEADIKKALWFYSDAALQGHKDASFKCGMIYGLQENDSYKALQYFWPAAREGHSLAEKIAEGMCEKRPYQTEFTSCADVVLTLYKGDLPKKDRDLIEENVNLLPPKQKKEVYMILFDRLLGM